MAKPTSTPNVDHKSSTHGESSSLKEAVHEATQGAEHAAETGNVETVKESSGGPMTDLPTGTRRSHPAE